MQSHMDAFALLLVCTPTRTSPWSASVSVPCKHIDWSYTSYLQSKSQLQLHTAVMYSIHNPADTNLTIMCSAGNAQFANSVDVSAKLCP